MSKQITIDGKRYTLTTFFEGPREETSPGIRDIALYIGKDYVIRHVYSIWQDQKTGICKGDIYELLHPMMLPLVERVYGKDAAEAAAAALGVST